MNQNRQQHFNGCYGNELIQLQLYLTNFVNREGLTNLPPAFPISFHCTAKAMSGS